MKRLLFTTITLVVLLTANVFGVSAQGVENNDASSMLKEFYTKYITESLKTPGPSRSKNINEIKMHYCTQNLLVKLPTGELDPFLKTQDIDNSYLENLILKRDLKNNNLYQVTYLDIYSQHYKIIMIAVIKQKDEFKIDNIL